MSSPARSRVRPPSERTSRRSRTGSTPWMPPSARPPRRWRRGPQAPHVSRLVPVLRPRVRVGGRGAIQPSDFAEPTPQEIVGLIEQIRAESLPRSSAPRCSRARSSSRSRRRRARPTSTTCATTISRGGRRSGPQLPRIDGVRLHHDRPRVGRGPGSVRGPRRHEPRAGRGRRDPLLMDELVRFDRVTCRYGVTRCS